MSLYGNLPEAKHAESGADPNPWVAAGKLQPAFRSRFAPPASVLRKQRPQSQGLIAARIGHVSTSQTGGDEESGVNVGFSLFGDVEDVYDPARPNEYEEVITEREKKKREAQLEAERQEALRREEERKEREEKRALERRRDRDRLWDRERDLEKDSDRDRDRERDRDRDRDRDRERDIDRDRDRDRYSGRNRSRSPAHEDTSYRRRSRPPSPDSPRKAAGSGASGKDKGMSLAQRMLERYGWREGEGLGKERQGMATPLIAQKTDKRSAVIVNAEKRKPADGQKPAEKKPRVGAALDGLPTKVVLLRNMVPPGDVDDELEEEVARELQRFGNVQRVLIFEVTEPDFPETESVRIFVKFERTEEATKAAVALQGRFFAGRVVKAGFYDEAKFEACDLAPEPGEFTA